MSDLVSVGFEGELAKLEADVAAARALLTDFAKTPVKVTFATDESLTRLINAANETVKHAEQTNARRIASETQVAKAVSDTAEAGARATEAANSKREASEKRVTKTVTEEAAKQEAAKKRAATAPTITLPGSDRDPQFAPGFVGPTTLLSKKELADRAQNLEVAKTIERAYADVVVSSTRQVTEAKQKAFRADDPAVLQEVAAKRAVSAKRVADEQVKGEAEAAEQARRVRHRAFRERIAEGLVQSRTLTAQLEGAARGRARAEAAAEDDERTKQRRQRRTRAGGPPLGPGSREALSQIGGALGIGGGLGLLGAAGPAAAFGLATAAAIKFGRDAGQSFEQAHQRNLALRASIEGLGLNFQTVAADAQNFADRHNQDITKINVKYAEFVRLAKEQGGVIDDVGQRALDIASKRHLSDEQLAQGLRNIRAGIADEAVLGAAAATVLLEYAAAHGKQVSALTESEKKQAVYNEFLRQGALAAGDAKTQTTGLTTATTQLGNAWERVNIEAGKYIERLVNSPVDIPKLLLPGGFLFLDNKTTPAEPDPKLKQQQEEAQRQAVEKNKQDLERAVNQSGQTSRNFTENIVSLALRQFVDTQKFLSPDADVAAEAKKKAVEAATAYVAEQVKQYKRLFAGAARDITQTQTLLKNFASLRNFIDPEEYKRVTDEAGRNIAAGFGRMIRDAKQNVPQLREIYGQIRLTPELLVGDRDDLSRQVAEAIKQAVEAGKQKLKELEGNIRGAFNVFTGIAEETNPFLAKMNALDRAMLELDKNTKGFSTSLRAAFAERHLEKFRADMFALRQEARLSSADLIQQAREFRRGYSQLSPEHDPQIKQLTSRLEQLQKLNELSAREPGIDVGLMLHRIAQGAKILDFGGTRVEREIAEQERLIKQREKEIEERNKREQQERVDERIRIAGDFRQRQVVVGRVSGGALPEENLIRTVSEPNRELDERQRALADRKIIELTNNLDPRTLSAFGREQAAGAREREAERQVDYEINAQKERVNQTGLQRQMLQELKRLESINAAGGIGALERIIGEGGLKVDLNGQPAILIEVRSKELEASKRTQAGRPSGQSTKSAMDLN